jgi:hypothetical protein
VRFGDINATYAATFQAFSAERLFAARNTHLLEVTFFIPGTRIPATVGGFGVIFTDVDSSSGGNRSLIRVYGPDGTQLSAASAPVADGGVSLVGISFNAGERIARVVIESGNAALSASNTDGVGGVDVVAMDDFIYGEPRAMDPHPADFDGDGGSDLSVFRPSVGTWFVSESGSGAFSAVPFGTAGDLAVNGDFDGDQRTDHGIFRPSIGTWFIRRSTDGGLTALQFGAPGDLPVPGDYDKDGRMDIAVWRPSDGFYYVIRSSNGAFVAVQWGLTGDSPVARSGG